MMPAFVAPVNGSFGAAADATEARRHGRVSAFLNAVNRLCTKRWNAVAWFDTACGLPTTSGIHPARPE
jgi:hypothetical protein